MARNSELKKLAASWRKIATGDYCQTYNKGMAEGLIKAAGELELHIYNNSASQRLRRTKRAVDDCPVCAGQGYIVYDGDKHAKCIECQGSGHRR